MAAKKPVSQVARPAISGSSLLYAPTDALEGFQERIETGIDWTLIELAARHHRKTCNSDLIVSFSKALKNKIKKSILHGFLNEESSLSLSDQWELLLPITIWDNEKFGNEESNICFHSDHFITNNLMKLIKKAVFLDDRQVLKQELFLVTLLRVNDSQMTELDEELLKFKKLCTLNLCGNSLTSVDSTFLPSCLRILELQSNCIKNIETLIEHLPNDLIYLGLARNLLFDDIDHLKHLPHNLGILDLSDNDICDFDLVLSALERLPCLTSLMLAGNPCSMCVAYSCLTIKRLPRLLWLDSREIIPTDRPLDDYEPHPHDLRSNYFNFTIFRVMSAPQPPKPEKGAITSFYVELEIPLLDAKRRNFLMFRQNESLTELLPAPEDDQSQDLKIHSAIADSKNFIPEGEASSHASDIYLKMTTRNPREICNFTTFESTKVQWNKIMNFTEPTVRIFCPDLVALRNTFRTAITLRLVYSMTMTTKKPEKQKSTSIFKPAATEQRVVLATIRCNLKNADWSQLSQHFHWDDSLGTEDALHWGDGDLSVLQYSFTQAKIVKAKTEADAGSTRQQVPENLTCHFGFGIDNVLPVKSDTTRKP